MKTASFKKILSAVLLVALVMTAIFVITSCKKHVHEFGDEVVVEATCTKDGSITKTCECGETQVTAIPATGHSLIRYNEKAATCTEEGNKAWEECKNCDYTTYTKIPAKGHDTYTVAAVDATCTETGCKAYEKCSACDYSTYSDDLIIPVAAHTPANAVVENNVPSTCTVGGNYDSVVYCSNCPYEISRENVSVDPLGHEMKEVAAQVATCQPGWDAYEQCQRCDHNTKVVIAPVYEHEPYEHLVVNEESVVPATCTDPGSRDWVRLCTLCDGIIEDPDSYTETLDPLGHDIVEHEAKAQDCTNVGWGAYEDCSRCDYTTYEEIPANGHTDGEAVKENEVAPTCATVGGYDDVVYCTVCEAEVSRTPVEVPTLEHEYGDKVYEAKPVSCTEDGWAEYQICTLCSHSTQVIEKAHGHEEGETVVENSVVPTCAEEGSYDLVVYCVHCEDEMSRKSYVVEPVAHELAYADAKAPNCTEIGWEAYEYCVKCEYTTYEELPIHHEIVKVDAKAPDCENIGWAAYEHCSLCDYTTYEEIPANGHSVVVLPAVAPTCLETGLTEGKYCSACDKVWSTQTVVKALGHDYDADGNCQNAGCSDRISVGASYELNSDGGYTFTGMDNCTDTEVIIPSEINGVPVTEVAEKAFYNNSTVKSVVIPDSVKTVGDEVFFNCTSLESVVIGDGVTEIGAYAFFYCRDLKSVTIGASVKTIGNDAFSYCPISVVYYEGTADQWNAITIGSNNGNLTGATRKYI